MSDLRTREECPAGAVGSETRSLRVDLRVYDLETVFRSAYIFTGQWYLHLVAISDSELEVRFTPKGASSDRATVVAEFLNSMIDQRVRRDIALETRQLRETIVSAALRHTTASIEPPESCS